MKAGDEVRVSTAGGGRGTFGSSARFGVILRVSEKSYLIRLHRAAEAGCFLGEKEVRITKASGRVRSRLV